MRTKRALIMTAVILLATVLLAWWSTTQNSTVSTESSVASSTAATTTMLVASSTASTTVSETDGLPLTRLPLSDGQRAFAETLGFDVDTMVISEAMITCVRDTLGESRYQNILAGGTPTWKETVRLLPCVRQ